MAAVIERLREALRRRFGASVDVDDVRHPTLGGSNHTTVFELVDGGTRRRLVCRQETVPAEGSPFLPSRHQFALLRAAWRHDVPVPEPLFELEPSDGLGVGYVMAFVAGESMPRRILDGEAFAGARAAMTRQCAEILARLHAIAVDEVPFLARRPESADPVGTQLALLDQYDEPHPAVELAARVLLREGRPPAEARVVHGDFRVGNLLVGESGITAVLDWECAHASDIHEDLAWPCLETWRFGHLDRPVGGFGARDELHEAYAALSGRPVDDDAVRWWTIYGHLRWVVLNVMQAHGHAHLDRRSPGFAACGRNASLYEHDLLRCLLGRDE